MRSLDFIHHFHLPKSSSIIDVGGGGSRLVDHLLEEGYEDITVLDISETSLDLARERLGVIADRVTWIVSDILDFQPSRPYEIWHDRATFHFLTTPSDIAKYMALVTRWASRFLAIATISDGGPTKLSGLDVQQYSVAALEAQFAEGFHKSGCITEDHTTPSDTHQTFSFCALERNL